MISSHAHGVGVGLRPPHYHYVKQERPKVPWLEVHSENYFGLEGGPGGEPLRRLLEIREHYPISLHGVSLSIGSTDPIDHTYLQQLKDLVARVDPCLVSDHLCWTGVEGQNIHDLLPLPYTEEAITHVSSRIRQAQDFLGRRLLIENVSSYVAFKHSVMPEWEFLSEVAERADCDILLDVNNIFVSSQNHSHSPEHYLLGVPKDRVKEIHLAGYSDDGPLLIDTHSRAVTQPVWDLYEIAVGLFGHAPTLIEWDDDIPEFNVLFEEAQKALRYWEKRDARTTAPDTSASL